MPWIDIHNRQLANPGGPVRTEQATCYTGKCYFASEYIYVGDSIENELRIFPNPTRNWLNVSFEHPFQFILYNDVGQNVMVGHSTGNAQIECGVLPKGVYILHIKTDGKMFIKKIIVQ